MSKLMMKNYGIVWNPMHVGRQGKEKSVFTRER